MFDLTGYRKGSGTLRRSLVVGAVGREELPLSDWKQKALRDRGGVTAERRQDNVARNICR